MADDANDTDMALLSDNLTSIAMTCEDIEDFFVDLQDEHPGYDWVPILEKANEMRALLQDAQQTVCPEKAGDAVPGGLDETVYKVVSQVLEEFLGRRVGFDLGIVIYDAPIH